MHKPRMHLTNPQLLDILKDKSEASEDGSYYSPISPSSINDRNPSPSPPAKPIKKPWIPIPGGECQFKCCNVCRPTLADRSWLSLNGIVNGEMPATAVCGFGFNLARKRPISKVKHVLNLGLRTPPVRIPSAPPQLSLHHRPNPIYTETTNPKIPRKTPSTRPRTPPIPTAHGSRPVHRSTRAALLDAAFLLSILYTTSSTRPPTLPQHHSP
jgi:hypothetical protein